jgi:hypothetical protein
MNAATPNRVLGGAEACFAIAAVALRRIVRGRAIAVVLGLSLVPLLLGLLRKTGDGTPLEVWTWTAELWAFLVAILVPILLGSSIGEEIEERTAAYLWSRPLPRWSIIIGKLIALVPLLAIIMGVSLILPGLILDSRDVTSNLPRLIGADFAGTFAVAALTAGVTSLTPRRGGIVSLVYLLFIDRILAWSDASIGKLSIAGHTLRLGGLRGGESALEALAWIAGISAVWIAVALSRIRRME